MTDEIDEEKRRDLERRREELHQMMRENRERERVAMREQAPTMPIDELLDTFAYESEPQGRGEFADICREEIKRRCGGERPHPSPDASSASMRRYGTVAFDRDFMRSTIGVGAIVQDSLGFARVEPDGSGILQFGLWFATVPDRYRPIAEAAIGDVCVRWLNRPVGARELERIVDEVRVECLRAIEATVTLA